jgi:hypothetical protein
MRLMRASPLDYIALGLLPELFMGSGLLSRRRTLSWPPREEKGVTICQLRPRLAVS